MKAYAITLVAGTLAVAALNFCVDPHLQWHLKKPSLAYGIPDGSVWIWPAPNIDEMYVKGLLFQSQPAPDLMLLGSSRAMPLRANLFRPGIHVFNASVNSAGINEYEAVWDWTEQVSRAPKAMVIFMDPWTLNGHLDWRPIPKWRRRWNDFTNLIAWPTLKQSLLALRSRIRREPQGIVSLTQKPVDGFAYDAQGAALFPAWLEKTPSKDELTRIIDSYTASGPENLSQWQLDEATLRRFEILLIRLKASKVKVTVILPPMQNEAYTAILTKAGYQSAFPEFREAVHQVTARHSIAFCDALDPAAVGCAPDEFRDAVHMLESCAVKVIAACADPGWGQIRT
jgi:hypothetical protein